VVLRPKRNRAEWATGVKQIVPRARSLQNSVIVDKFQVSSIYVFQRFSTCGLRSTTGGPRTYAWWSSVKGYFLLFKVINTQQTNLTIFHDTIFGGGPQPRDQICKWSSSLIDTQGGTTKLTQVSWGKVQLTSLHQSSSTVLNVLMDRELMSNLQHSSGEVTKYMNLLNEAIGPGKLFGLMGGQS